MVSWSSIIARLLFSIHMEFQQHWRLKFTKKTSTYNNLRSRRSMISTVLDKNYLFAWGAAIRGAERVCAHDLSTLARASRGHSSYHGDGPAKQFWNCNQSATRSHLLSWIMFKRIFCSWRRNCPRYVLKLFVVKSTGIFLSVFEITTIK